MNASMVPLEAASKQSNAGMIWPPRENLDPEPPAGLISSTIFASRSAAPLHHVER